MRSDAQPEPFVTVVETERLQLRRIQAGDAEFLLELLNEPAFLQFVGDRGVRNLEDAHRYIETGPQASYERHGFGLFLTVLKDSGAPIGICGLLKRDELDAVDVGYANLAHYCGRGYAVEAAKAVMRYGEHELGLKRILAIVDEGNVASIRLLDKLGMHLLGPTRIRPDAPELLLYAWDAPAMEQDAAPA